MNDLVDTVFKNDTTAANIAIFSTKLSVILNKINKIGGTINTGRHTVKQTVI